MSTWWGYVHVDGSICAQRYVGQADVIEAYANPFILHVVLPFEAESSAEALLKVGEVAHERS